MSTFRKLTADVRLMFGNFVHNVFYKWFYISLRAIELIEKFSISKTFYKATPTASILRVFISTFCSV